jgi:hypothetical protein
LHSGRWGLPRKTTLDRGWAALCFRGQDYCGRWMEFVSSRAGREFTVQASLWGKPGLTRNVIVLMVPPRANSDAPPQSRVVHEVPHTMGR